MRVTRRLLPTPEAAQYVGARSPKAFLRQWRRGLWPDPFYMSTKPMLWDHRALDAWINRGRPQSKEPELEDLI